MKKILILILVLALIAGGLIGFMAVNTLSFSTGRCLVADNGSVMLILGNSPIVLSNRGGAGMLDGLSTGDEILVLHDGIQESYPGGTGAYFLLRLGGGSLADIPENVAENVVRELTELGWLS